MLIIIKVLKEINNILINVKKSDQEKHKRWIGGWRDGWMQEIRNAMKLGPEYSLITLC